MTTTERTPDRPASRARAELTGEIKAVARRQLAEEGSAALSLRAVARELGMVSSAVYRYFPSRDELLTALIIDAYDAVADAAEQAEAAVEPRRPDAAAGSPSAGPFATWAVANPQEYALIYGSPIPGYAAPQDTIDPAARIPRCLLRGAVRRRWPPAAIVADARRAAAPVACGATWPRCARGRARRARRRAGAGHHRLDPAVRRDQLRAVRPPPQRDPRLRRLLRPRDRRARPTCSSTDDQG